MWKFHKYWFLFTSSSLSSLDYQAGSLYSQPEQSYPHFSFSLSPSFQLEFSSFTFLIRWVIVIQKVNNEFRFNEVKSLFYQISEHIIDYTFCKKFDELNNIEFNRTCAEEVRHDKDANCKCKHTFSLDLAFQGDVFFYYGLTNFYQNHRRYVKSRDDNQLLGEFGEPSTDCAPFNMDDGKAIVPCGAIANSLFNDTFRLMSVSHGEIKVKNTGIAWPSDKEIKFRNPPGRLNDSESHKCNSLENHKIFES